MNIEAKVIADSLAYGSRLTTIAVTIPRFTLAETNTHRVFSRNTASSRAIPVRIRCEMVEEHPFVPVAFGKNKAGMQSSEMLGEAENEEAKKIWLEAAADAAKHARRMMAVGVHKQYANRLTETFAWVTQLITATEWDNFFHLRNHPDAQPELVLIAQAMKRAMDMSTPRDVPAYGWHLPYVREEDWSSVTQEMAIKLSVARCARVSHETQDKSKLLEDELGRYDSLLAGGHMSPFEHQATVAVSAEQKCLYGTWKYDTSSPDWFKTDQKYTMQGYGNFRAPWLQYRKTLPGEAVFKAAHPTSG